MTIEDFEAANKKLRDRMSVLYRDLKRSSERSRRASRLCLYSKGVIQNQHLHLKSLYEEIEAIKLKLKHNNEKIKLLKDKQMSVQMTFDAMMERIQIVEREDIPEHADWPKEFPFAVEDLDSGFLALFPEKQPALNYRLDIVNERLNAYYDQIRQEANR